MARLRVPKTAPIVQKLCKEAGVKLRRFTKPEAFEKEVVKFLKRHDTVYLATSSRDVPRCTPLGYEHIGTTLYILSEGGGKLANLKKNPKVCYAISSRIKGGRGLMKIAGLQCWGKAAVISMKNDKERFYALLEKLKAWQIIKKQDYKKLLPYHYRVIKITPDRITLLNLPEGINNITWSRR